MDQLMNICSAFGLSGAAGLNAYIPLLVLSVMQHEKMIHLAKPYDAMGQWWCIALLVVLLIIELVVDKVPGADHINDLIHTAIRPAAGALIFASQTGHITWIHPGVWMALGLLTSGGVHTTKALTRPVVNVGTAGIGAPIVSTVENLVSTVLSIVAILAPILAVIMMGVFGWLLFKLFRKFFGRRKGAGFEPVVVHAVPVPAAAAVDAPQPLLEGAGKPGENWGGGM